LNTVMELFVLSDRQLASIAEWQQAIAAEGFPLLLSTEIPFEALDGFLPAQLGEKPTGFECSHWDPRNLIDRHREFGQANCLHAQANVADGTQARADEQPADVRHHDPPRERRMRGEPVSQRCEYPQQCVQIQAISTYSPAGQAPVPTRLGRD